jgi:hypothetical protein
VVLREVRNVKYGNFVRPGQTLTIAVVKMKLRELFALLYPPERPNN